MKKVVLLVLFVFLPLATWAQDIITKKDGNDIEAKILEVSSTDIKYKKFSNLDGPTYSVAVKDVFMIRYQNGEKDVFNDNLTSSRPAASYASIPNLKYVELKEMYDFHDYVPAFSDKYSVGWNGVASAFIPGLGQAICNEWGRAACFFFSNAVLSSVGSYLVKRSYEDYAPWWKYDIAGAVVCYTACAAVDVWSIVDAVRISKVKNLYYRDAQSSSIDIHFSPSFAFTPTGINSLQPTAGMSIKVTF